MSVHFLAAVVGALIAAVGTGLLVARCLRAPGAALVAWTVALFGLTVSLGAQAVGYHAGFGPMAFRAMEIGAQVLAPLALALGLAEVAGKSIVTRFAARLLLAALAIVALVIFATDPLSAAAFTKAWPATTVYYQIVPNKLLEYVLAPAVAIVALIAIGDDRRPARPRPGVAGRRPGHRGRGRGGAPARGARHRRGAGAVGADGLAVHAAVRAGRGGDLVRRAVGRPAAARPPAPGGRRRRRRRRARSGPGSGRGPAARTRPGISTRWRPTTSSASTATARTGSVTISTSAPGHRTATPGTRTRPRRRRAGQVPGRGRIPGRRPPDDRRPWLRTGPRRPGTGTGAGYPDDGRPRPRRAAGRQPELFGQIAIYTLLEDRVDDFDRLTKQVVRQVRAHEPDTLVYIVHAVPSAPMQRILYEVYSDRAAYEAHKRQPYVVAFEADRRPLRARHQHHRAWPAAGQGVAAALGRRPAQRHRVRPAQRHRVRPAWLRPAAARRRDTRARAAASGSGPGGGAHG